MREGLMNATAVAATPLWFRIVAILAVLWNLVGVWSYLAHVKMAPPMQEMTAELEALEATVPVWVTAAFAIAVFAALIGSVGLLLGRAWARALLLLSLLCILVQMGWVVLMSEATAVQGSQALIMPAFITVVALLLVWVANVGLRRGWLS
jgi:hypothetical protein